MSEKPNQKTMNKYNEDGDKIGYWEEKKVESTSKGFYDEEGLRQGEWLIVNHHSLHDTSVTANYLNGKLHGEYREMVNVQTQEDVDMKLTKITSYTNGRLDGKFEEFDALVGNKIRETNYVDGIEHGVRLTYHLMKDELYSEQTIVDGLQLGEMKFYKDGRLHVVGTKVNGIKLGDWLFYNEEGLVYLKISYNDMGDLTLLQEGDNIIMEIKYANEEILYYKDFNGEWYDSSVMNVGFQFNHYDLVFKFIKEKYSDLEKYIY